jgi:hypothetical protein
MAHTIRRNPVSNPASPVEIQVHFGICEREVKDPTFSWILCTHGLECDAQGRDNRCCHFEHTEVSTKALGGFEGCRERKLTKALRFAKVSSSSAFNKPLPSFARRRGLDRPMPYIHIFKQVHTQPCRRSADQRTQFRENPSKGMCQSMTPSGSTHWARSSQPSVCFELG